MTYQETLQYLYDRLPVFHRVGAVAMKSGLHNIIALCEALGNPHTQFKSIHVAGTNGKGSTSHFLSAVLQSAGYKVGLHTSPHLKSYTERFKINGQSAPESEIVEFVAKHQTLIEEIEPSFFEISVALAFDYFAREKVDVGVIEVGLGGRLDSTNIITPDLSVITNISFDHTDLLGDTLAKIAPEKAGIIKPGVPVVISETQAETEPVFRQKAFETQSEIVFADQNFQVIRSNLEAGKRVVDIKPINSIIKTYKIDLIGIYQSRNLLGVLQSVEILRQIGYKISEEALRHGLANAALLSQLKGRWQVLQQNPIIVADVAHNYGGLSETLAQIQSYDFNRLHVVMGFVKDKDISGVLQLFPKDAAYYFCAADIPRSLSVADLAALARRIGLNGKEYASVNDALSAAKRQAEKDDFIYVGGSTFVVAEV
jgi:dihydrofolate synthase / folylpolyglutamate synthase